MDYEKKYKDALERARVWKEKSGMPKDKQGILDDIFPELKESEDERIRKALIFYLGDMPEDTELRNGVTNRDVLAWLEKQGEKEAADKANPTLEDKVSILADEIIALKERVKALEIQVIKQCSDKNRLDSLESKMIILDSYNINERLDMNEMKLSALEKLAKDSEIRIDALECGGKPFQCPDKAGDNVTLEEMKS